MSAKTEQNLVFFSAIENVFLMQH